MNVLYTVEQILRTVLQTPAFPLVEATRAPTLSRVTWGLLRPVFKLVVTVVSFCVPENRYDWDDKTLCYQESAHILSTLSKLFEHVSYEVET